MNFDKEFKSGFLGGDGGDVLKPKQFAKLEGVGLGLRRVSAA